MVFRIPRLPYYLPHFWIKDLVEKRVMNVSVSDEEAAEMKFVKSFRASNRDLVIVQYIFPYEKASIYACIDSETGMVLADVFISESNSISYLENITKIDSVPPELLLKVRYAVFVDATTNKTLVIPNHRIFVKYSQSRFLHSHANANTGQHISIQDFLIPHYTTYYRSPLSP